MSKEAYQNALDRLEEIDPAGEDRAAILSGLFIDELGETHTHQNYSGSESTEPGKVRKMLKRTDSLSKEEISKVIEFGEEEFYLLKQPQPGTKKGRLQRTALLYLAIRKVCYGEKKCSSPELTKFLKDQGAYSTAMGSYLGDYENFVYKDKGKKPQDTVYWATQPGVGKVEEIIKEITSECIT